MRAPRLVALLLAVTAATSIAPAAGAAPAPTAEHPAAAEHPPPAEPGPAAPDSGGSAPAEPAAAEPAAELPPAERAPAEPAAELPPAERAPAEPAAELPPAEPAEPPPPPVPAYWLVGSDGGVFAFGGAEFAGAVTNTPLNSAIAAMAVTPQGQGYWLVARDGGVFAFGDAPFLGSASGLPLNRPVVDVAATPSGLGYWLVASDGGVFAFGDAPWLGGLGATPLNAPVTAIVPTATGQGYWLATRDGGVFAFGDAPWWGGLAGTPLGAPVNDMAATPSGQGYWLAGADGGVFAFGDAPFHGAAVAATAHPVIGIAAGPGGDGYWLAAADGGVFAFGDAPFQGAAADEILNTSVVGFASGLGRRVLSDAPTLRSTFGWDVSWPQCGTRLPGGRHAFAVVGVTGGRAFTANPCLAGQHRWSLANGSLGGLYVNVNFPSVAAEATLPLLMIATCAPADRPCQLHRWGALGAAEAVDAADRLGVSSPMWWLDVEIANRWSRHPVENEHVIRGAIDALHARRLTVGIYSTPYQWRVIAGEFAPGLPTWVAGPRNAEEAARACAGGLSFGGGEAWMVQYPYQGLDGNLMCEAGAREALRAFRLPPLRPADGLPGRTRGT